MKKAFLIFLLVFLVSGCVDVDGNFENVKETVLAGLKENVEKQMEFSVGGLTLSLAGAFLSDEDEDEAQAQEMLSNVSNVQVGIYNRLECRRTDFNFINKTAKRISSFGLIPIVKARNGEEAMLMFVNNVRERGEIEKILVVAINPDEIVIAQVDGNIGNLIETAVKDKGFNIGNNY